LCPGLALAAGAAALLARGRPGLRGRCLLRHELCRDAALGMEKVARLYPLAVRGEHAGHAPVWSDCRVLRPQCDSGGSVVRSPVGALDYALAPSSAAIASASSSIAGARRISFS